MIELSPLFLVRNLRMERKKIAISHKTAGPRQRTLLETW